MFNQVNPVISYLLIKKSLSTFKYYQNHLKVTGKTQFVLNLNITSSFVHQAELQYQLSFTCATYVCRVIKKYSILNNVTTCFV